MSSTTSSQSKATALAQVQALIAGAEKHFPSGQFTLGGTTFTTASLVQALQGLANAMTALNAAQKGAKDALTALQSTETTVDPTLRAFRKLVLAAFASSTQTLADFGLQPPKARTPLTSEQKAAAAAKMRATRKARGTTSKKQKLTVSGNVTGVDITPVTAPASPTPQAPTAPTATPTGSVSK